MIRQVVGCVFLSLLCMVSVARATQAQSKSKAAFTSEVPFEFIVGNRTLPAGTYIFEMPLGVPTQADGIGMLVVRSIDHSVYVALMTDSASAADARPQSTAIFSRYGGRTFLSQVWQQGRSLGLQLHNSRSDAESAQVPEEF